MSLRLSILVAFTVAVVSSGAFAGSLSIPTITIDQVASRAPHGVSVGPTAWTALSIG